MVGQPGSPGGSSGSGGPPADGGGTGHRRRSRSTPFRNRERELEDICTAIFHEDGEHFWLVIAPPQLGKSWLLEEIGDKVNREWRGRFTVRLVDVRGLPAEATADAEAILLRMFGHDPASTEGRPVADAIVSQITMNSSFHLCLLDSAELLADSTVRALRRHLNEINGQLGRVRSGSVRLALVVASRRESEWKGVTPPPRFKIRRLTEFRVEVIYAALEELARETNRSFATEQIQEIAQRVHALGEGLPALLAGSLRWIRDRGWNDLELLEDPATFDEIAKPYIEKDLLSPGSLSARGSTPTNDQRAAIEQALLKLSPYRFLTMSHLTRQVSDGALQNYLEQLGWRVTDLWDAVSGADLLYVPLWQPWHEVYAPIRRLLCRHAYPAVADRVRAHQAALQFTRPFMLGLYGSDQCRALVECLWQQVQILTLVRSADLEETLTRLGGELSARLSPVPGIDSRALREMAVRFIENDQEFVDAIASVDGLQDRLTQAIRQPR
jgi:hypothetical protein